MICENFFFFGSHVGWVENKQGWWRMNQNYFKKKSKTFFSFKGSFFISYGLYSRIGQWWKNFMHNMKFQVKIWFKKFVEYITHAWNQWKSDPRANLISSVLISNSGKKRKNLHLQNTIVPNSSTVKSSWYHRRVRSNNLNNSAKFPIP